MYFPKWYLVSINKINRYASHINDRDSEWFQVSFPTHPLIMQSRCVECYIPGTWANDIMWKRAQWLSALMFQLASLCVVTSATQPWAVVQLQFHYENIYNHPNKHYIQSRILMSIWKQHIGSLVIFLVHGEFICVSYHFCSRPCCIVMLMLNIIGRNCIEKIYKKVNFFSFVIL